MGYLAIARKWRPNRFDNLVGQSHVVQTLKNAIAYERVTHAYLFSGPRGVGKTTVARIFSMALRCPNTKDGTPCTTCEECLAISESRSVDVVEIDGASNNGVEAIRGIRENVAYSASTGVYKIYIIDEVHMLSLSAFNALLKTLEEPPPHVIFIFATTEMHKIPLTILSRCQRFEFRRLTSSQIVARLNEILIEEKLSFSDDALRLIASYGDGSLRDSLSLLDQVLSYFGQEARGKSLSEKDVVEALGITDTGTLTSFLGAVLKKDIKSAIRLVGEIYQGGIDLKRFAERCLEDLRLIYLMTLMREQGESASPEMMDVSSSRFSELEALAKQATLIQIERMSQILGKAIGQLSWSSLPRYVLEMAAVRMAHLDTLAKIEAALLASPDPENRSKNADQKPIVTGDSSTESLPEADLMNAQSSSKPEKPPMPVEAPPRNWVSFVDMVMKKRPLLGALLCHAEFRPDSKNEKKATIAFAKGSFYERQALENKNRSEIFQLYHEFFGNDGSLEIGATTEPTMMSIEQSRLNETAQIKREAMEHPSVTQMQEILGAELVDVSVKLEV